MWYSVSASAGLKGETTLEVIHARISCGNFTRPNPSVADPGCFEKGAALLDLVRFQHLGTEALEIMSDSLFRDCC